MNSVSIVSFLEIMKSSIKFKASTLKTILQINDQIYKLMILFLTTCDVEICCEISNTVKIVKIHCTHVHNLSSLGSIIDVKLISQVKTGAIGFTEYHVLI